MGIEQAVQIEDLEFEQPKNMVSDFTMFGHALEMNLNKHIVDEYAQGMAHQEKLFSNSILSLDHSFKTIAHIIDNAAYSMPKYAKELKMLSAEYIAIGHSIKHKKTEGIR